MSGIKGDSRARSAGARILTRLPSEERFRHASFFHRVACLFDVLSLPALAQEERYPALGQGDMTPGSPNLPGSGTDRCGRGGDQPEYMGSDDYEAVFKPAIDFSTSGAAFW